MCQYRVMLRPKIKEHTRNPKSPSRKWLRLSHGSFLLINLPCSFLRLKYSIFPIRVASQQFPVTGWHWLMGTVSSSGWQDYCTGANKGLNQKKLLQRIWHPKGPVTERSFNDAVCSPLSHQVSNGGRKHPHCGLLSPFCLLFTLTL